MPLPAGAMLDRKRGERERKVEASDTFLEGRAGKDRCGGVDVNAAEETLHLVRHYTKFSSSLREPKTAWITRCISAKISGYYSESLSLYP